MSALRTIVLIVMGSLLLGCPPVRENVGEGTGGGESFQSALLALDPYTGSQYELAYIYLVDSDYDCNTIIQDYGLSWWNLPNGTPWVSAFAYRGQFVEWESTFRSQYLWNQEATWELPPFARWVLSGDAASPPPPPPPPPPATMLPQPPPAWDTLGSLNQLPP